MVLDTILKYYTFILIDICLALKISRTDECLFNIAYYTPQLRVIFNSNATALLLKIVSRNIL